MITLIPYQRFVIKTRFSKNVTLGKVAILVESRNLWRTRHMRDHRPFEGELDGFDFKISRVSRNRRNIPPILTGEIQNELDSSIVKITAHPPIIMSILVIGLLYVPIFYTIFGEGSASVYQAWLTYGLFYALVITSFNFELNKAKKLLDKQLEVDCISLP